LKKILVTGGCGFIGSNFVRLLLSRRRDLAVVNLDKLTYAGNPENLRGVDSDPRYEFIRGDIADPGCVVKALEGCSAVVHFAAESHVDRSIANAGDFLRTNVIGTHVLLDAARAARIERFLHISTDEVYGSLPEGEANEDYPLRPNSPYAASKAAAEQMVRAYHVTYGFPTVVVRGTNNFGPYQFPEKLIPLMLTNALSNEPLPIYGDGKYVREWLYVEDFCEAVLLLLEKGDPGEVFNAGSGERPTNLDVVSAILKVLGKPESLVRHVTDRLGHDRRYAVDSRRIRQLGWTPRRRFNEAIGETIRWYQQNSRWWQPLKAHA